MAVTRTMKQSITLYFISTLCLILVGCKSLEERDQPPLTVWSVSKSGQFAIRMELIYKPELSWFFELVQVEDYAKGLYRVIDTVPSGEDFPRFDGDSLVYWVEHADDGNRLYCGHVREIDSSSLVYHEKLPYNGSSVLDEHSKFLLSDSAITSMDGLWRLESDGLVTHLAQLDTRFHSSFSLDGSEALLALGEGIDSLGRRTIRMASYNFADDSLSFEFETVLTPGNIQSRGAGKPIYINYYSFDHGAWIIGEFDRKSREMTVVAEARPPNRLSTLWVLRDSLLYLKENSEDNSEELIIMNR